MSLVDAKPRERALLDLDSTLLVEAAAGTGKTSLMAGRAAMLLASGCEPRNLAAITFTELAAGELALRIRQMVESLLAGEIPKVLELALPRGLTPAQRQALEHAAAQLDELTATTIHGFCQGMIRSYAVEADLDPGAVVIDAAQADAMFAGVFSRWLVRRLSGADLPDDPVAVLSKDDPLGVVETLRELAELRRRRPTARPPAVDLSRRPDIDFAQAVDDFARWFAAGPGERETAAILEDLQALAAFYTDTLVGQAGFGELWRLASPPRRPIMKDRSFEWRAYACETAWRKAATGGAAEVLIAAAENHYRTCRTRFAALLGQLAGALVYELSGALDEVLADYAREKRAAAVLDFDDLVICARRLLREHEPVRQALARRYCRVFVDEFQDTDPVQAEIIFNLASDPRPERWQDAQVRPGALFLVGDPKQAIYRFRGAHVGAYQAVRDIFAKTAPDTIVQITANFRSNRGIIEHVNSCFETALSRTGQPGYVALAPTLENPPDGIACTVKLTVEVPPGASAGEQRDEEALAVADLCRRLVGAVDVRRADGRRTPLQPGDIALLAPTGTELWRYERALEDAHLSVASQAGKTLMLRQETQDLLALARVLADPFDTLAFGALMRGPLVGLSEAQLLDIAGSLAGGEDDEPPAFSVRTAPELVADPVARSVLVVLQNLRRRAASCTPKALLSEAVERLKVRVALALRAGDRSSRALANVDAVLQLAEPYSVRGLGAFVADFQAKWEAQARVPEGRGDASENAVEIVTIHSSKGLEWPVVIPINTATQLRGPNRFVHRQSDDTLHWVIGGVTPPELATAQAEESETAAREHERMWYVACTRARELLIIPHLPNAGSQSWSKILDLGHDRLEELDLRALRPAAGRRTQAGANLQTAEVFAAEQDRVAAAAPHLSWRRPSDHDPDRVGLLVTTAQDGDDAAETPEPVGAGRIRGILLHKLMEELLTGELPEDLPSATARANELRDELAAIEGIGPEGLPDGTEMAATALRTLGLPDVAVLRPQLLPEVAIYGRDDSGVLLVGRADAVAIESGRITAVLDWKSDIAPTAEQRTGYSSQLAAYLAATKAPKGAIVYMSRDEVVWLRQ